MKDRNEGNEIYLEYQREGDEEDEEEANNQGDKKDTGVKNNMYNLSNKLR